MFDFYYEIHIKMLTGGSFIFKLDKLNLETDDIASLIEWGVGMLSAMPWTLNTKSAYILMNYKTGIIKFTIQNKNKIEIDITQLDDDVLWMTAKIEYMISKMNFLYKYTISPKNSKVVYNKVRLCDELLHSDIKLKPIVLQIPDIIV